ncbi:MAG TPA: PVC-type heme-binding CxxCH protein [Chthoniobacteraceae bacterium]|jgi:azurin/lysophospholipase L1-like esterase
MNYRSTLSALLLLSLTAFTQAAPVLDLQTGERIALIGNALADRMQHDSYLEALIHKAFPEKELTVRNLGFAGDEVATRARSDNFGSPHDWLKRVQAGVVLAFFGFNESFRGPEGLEGFKAELAKFVEETKRQNYSRKGAPRLVLFSPIAHEKMPDANLTSPEKNTTNLELYTRAMAEVAQAKDVPFVDLFAASRQLYSSAKQPLTFNGIHLTEAGNKALAPVIFKALFAADPPTMDAALEKLRAAVQEKNEIWESRYRTVDGYNVFGGRSKLGYESGKGGPKITNFQVMQEEMSVRDVMTANRDRRVWAAANGSELIVDDANLPKVTEVKTNHPGPKEDGSHVFLSGEAMIKEMKVPAGVKVNLFASEEQFPELIKPVQMAWDTKGRLWVAAWPTYPGRTPWDKKGDRLLVLEDTDGDGHADKCTTFLDGLNCPTGFQFYKDGVLVMQAPNLWFVRDTNGDGKADWKERVLMGVDSADSHHQTNSMALDPSGGVYLNDGVFHHSQVETATGVVRNHDGAIYRYEPRTEKFERYAAYGFANPHGRSFDEWGNDIITDATGNQNYFGPAFTGFIDYPHKHPQMEPFWTRPARPCSGTGFLSSRAWPEEFQGNFLNCNVISMQGIFRVKVSEQGSGLKGQTLEHLVSSTHPTFRPSAVNTGPDGAVYFADWSNAIIGHLQHHLRDPNRDHTHGRIYRLTYEGYPLIKPAKIAGEPIPKLLDLLKEPENGTRERVKIELGTRETAQVVAAVDQWIPRLNPKEPAYEHHLMEALWVKAWHSVTDLPLLQKMLRSPDYHARAAATRVLCDQRERVPTAIALIKVQANDEHPRVRLEAVRAASFFRQWEAADAALTALLHPTDYYIDYCLGETMRQLEPWWKAGLREGRALAANNPVAVDLLLARLSPGELAQLPKSTLVYMALLTRPDVADPQRMEALEELAKLNKATPAATLLETLAPLAGKGGKAATDLSRLLLLQSAAELQGSRPALTKLATSGVPDAIRLSARAALLLADASVQPAWTEAVKSPSALTDLLRALSLLPDPALRASAFDLVKPLLTSFPPETQAALGARIRPAGRFVRIELPRKGTLTLAEVQVFSGGRNIAGHGKASQSSTAYDGKAERAIDGVTNGEFSKRSQSHTKEDENNPWWEVDMQKQEPIEAISVWTRNEKGGEYLARLEGFTVTVLDAERRSIFKSAGNAAPKESARIEVESDHGVPLRRAAIQALVSIGKEPEAIFAALAQLIARNEQVTAAAQGIMQLPRTAWSKEQAAPAVAGLISWAQKIPAGSRTSQDFVETLQVGSELAGLLPAANASAARKMLRDLGVTVFVVKAVPEQMRFDTTRLVVEAGKPFEIIFENPDAMPHNLVIVAPGSREEIGQAAQTMPPTMDKEGKAYVPKSAKVLLASKLLDPRQKETLKFTAPKEPGDYEYVCTFPGHWMIMWGKLAVVADVEEYLQKNPLPAAEKVAAAREHHH